MTVGEVEFGALLIDVKDSTTTITCSWWQVLE